MITPEHKAKMLAGRQAFIIKRREEKALRVALEKENQKIITPEEKLALAREENNIANSRDHVLKVIHKNKREILDAQIEAAKGLSFITDLGTKIYKKLPDTKTGEYLLNQLIGKPVESLEIKQITKLQVDI